MGSRSWLWRSRQAEVTLIALLALGPGAAAGQAGLSYERAAGLGVGLKPPARSTATLADPASGEDTMQLRQTLRAFDYALYGGVSVGLQYRTYGWDAAGRGMPMETTPANGYSLAPSRLTGSASAQGYQLHMSYQYSTAGAFGLAWGRDVETFAPFADAFFAGQRHFSFTGQHWLTPSWALNYDVLPGDIAMPLRVQGLRLGMRYRF